MTRNMKLKDDTHKIIKNLSRELSRIEEDDVTMQDVADRTFKAPDLPQRLKAGSESRRRSK